MSGNSIIGGAATDDTLAAILKTFPHHVWSTYGMTETLSHVALRPLSGPKAGPWYEPLPGVTLSESSRGTLVISAPAIDVPRIETNDIVKFAEGSKEFRVLGRVDNVIDTGGIKVPAEALEDAIRPEMPAPLRGHVASGRGSRKRGDRGSGVRSPDRAPRLPCHSEA